MQEYLKFVASQGKKIANKNLGQNFLKNEDYINQIVQSININPKTNIIEIGCGLGSLTYPILQKTQNFIGIEKDTDLVNFLRSKFPNTNFINDDALKFNFQSIIDSNSIIVSNLPYNIGTKLIIKIGIEALSSISGMVIMLQSDVIDKIISTYGNNSYHQIGIFFQSFCEIKHICNVPSSAFSPSPNVVSSVVSITAKKHQINLGNFWAFLQKIFNGKRKTISSICGDQSIMYGDKRPHQLTVEQFLELFNYLG